MIQSEMHGMTDDQARSVAPELFEVDHFAAVHGLTTQRALQLIEQHGNDAAELNEAVAKLKAKIASH